MAPIAASAAKDLELVEFADFQCPHCKEAQANMDKLAVDFPKARIVFQNYPLARIHPQASRAAAYGVCVDKLGGSNAFFSFAAAVFDGQDGLATADGATLTLNSAVTKAGLDPAKVAACAATPATVAAVEGFVKLAAVAEHQPDADADGEWPQGPRRHALRHHQADRRVPGQAGRRDPVDRGPSPKQEKAESPKSVRSLGNGITPSWGFVLLLAERSSASHQAAATAGFAYALARCLPALNPHHRRVAGRLRAANHMGRDDDQQRGIVLLRCPCRSGCSGREFR